MASSAPPMSTTLRIIGGTAPYHATLVRGTAARRRDVRSSTLTIAGTPTETGGFGPLFDITDNTGETLRAHYYFTVRNGVPGDQHQQFLGSRDRSPAGRSIRINSPRVARAYLVDRWRRAAPGIHALERRPSLGQFDHARQRTRSLSRQLTAQSIQVRRPPVPVRGVFRRDTNGWRPAGRVRWIAVQPGSVGDLWSGTPLVDARSRQLPATRYEPRAA